MILSFVVSLIKALFVPLVCFVFVNKVSLWVDGSRKPSERQLASEKWTDHVYGLQYIVMSMAVIFSIAMTLDARQSTAATNAPVPPHSAGWIEFIQIVSGILFSRVGMFTLCATLFAFGCISWSKAKNFPSVAKVSEEEDVASCLAEQVKTRRLVNGFGAGAFVAASIVLSAVEVLP